MSSVSCVNLLPSPLLGTRSPKPLEQSRGFVFFAAGRGERPSHARAAFSEYCATGVVLRVPVNQESRTLPLSLEEIGLYNLLARVNAGNGSVDGFLRFNLLQRGMVLEGEPLRLSMRGQLELQRLAEQLPSRADV